MSPSPKTSPKSRIHNKPLFYAGILILTLGLTIGGYYYLTHDRFDHLEVGLSIIIGSSAIGGVLMAAGVIKEKPEPDEARLIAALNQQNQTPFPNCQTLNDQDAKFCKNCGGNL